jgi:hypothetical protein
MGQSLGRPSDARWDRERANPAKMTKPRGTTKARGIFQARTDPGGTRTRNLWLRSQGRSTAEKLENELCEWTLDHCGDDCKA